MCLAAKRRSAASASLLFEYGAEINVADTQGQTPLHYMFLKDAGGPPAELARFLLSKGSNLEAKDKKGRTPLHFAIRRGINQEVLGILLGHGASVNTQDDNGQTPLHCVMFQSLTWYYLAFTQILLDHGAEVDVKDTDGRTPIDLAVEKGFHDRVALLQERKLRDI